MPIDTFVDNDYFFANKALKEVDYNKVLRHLEKIFSSSEFRIPSIRRSFSDLTSTSYQQYVEFQNESPLINELAEGVGEDLFVEIDNILIQFETIIQSGFFPNFEREYFAPFEAWALTNYHEKRCSEDGLLLLENSNFHSLLIAAYEFESKLKEMWEDQHGNYSMVVTVDFLVPAEIEGSFEIKMKVNIALLI